MAPKKIISIILARTQGTFLSLASSESLIKWDESIGNNFISFKNYCAIDCLYM